MVGNFTMFLANKPKTSDLANELGVILPSECEVENRCKDGHFWGALIATKTSSRTGKKRWTARNDFFCLVHQIH